MSWKRINQKEKFLNQSESLTEPQDVYLIMSDQMNQEPVVLKTDKSL